MSLIENIKKFINGQSPKNVNQRLRLLVWVLVGILIFSTFYFIHFLDILEKINQQNLQAGFFEAALRESKKEKESTLLFVGDIMLDRGVEHYIERHNNDFRYPFFKVAEKLRAADLAFGNLEGPISGRGRDQGSIYSFRFNPKAVEGLVYAGFDVLSLANNHIWDWGREALEDTILLLEENKIKPIGVGRNYTEANEPVFFNIENTKIAFFAYTTFYPPALRAGENNSGISHFDLEIIKEKIGSARQKADLIIISFHWGEEYALRSNFQQQRIGHSLIEAGADLIIGHHPHVVQEIERYQHGWIAYSLGNFIFDQGFSEETMRGLMLEAKIRDKKIVALEPIEIRMNNTFQPEIANLIKFEKNIITDDFTSARSVHAADVDNDGDLDILGAARYAHQIAWWRNEGEGEFTKFVIDGDFRGAFSVHAVDLDKDGNKDAIGASLYGYQVAWWRNNGDGTFGQRRAVDDKFFGAIYTYSADIDNDGYFDILAAGESINQIAWWRNQGNGTFGSKMVIGDNFKGARSVHAADIDNDGNIDVLGTARFADQIAWWRNNGDGSFTQFIIDDNFDGPRSVYTGDIDNDGDLDILGAARYAHQVAWWRNDGEGIFTKFIIDNKFGGATNVHTADLNNDGNIDIIVAAVYDDQIAWWRNDGEGQFVKFIIEKNFDGATFVYTADINGDGYKDILVPAVFDNQIGLWLNNS